MATRACKRGQMRIKGRCIDVAIVPKKELDDMIVATKKDIRNYEYPENMDTAQGYGYREGTIDTLNWVKNYRLEED